MQLENSAYFGAVSSGKCENQIIMLDFQVTIVILLTVRQCHVEHIHVLWN